MYSLDYEIRYNDYKDFDTVRPVTALEVIQDIAIRDSSEMGYDLDTLKNMGVAWLLKGFNVHFEKPISTHAPLEAFTAIQRTKASTSERGSVIKQNGEVIVKSIANWFLFSAERMRPCKIPPEMASVCELYDFEDEFFTYQKPASVLGLEPEYYVRVSNKDIDTNRHINNLKSAEILMDTLPFEYFFSDMAIIYKKQAYLGDTLGVCSKKTDGGYYASLIDKDRNICVEATFTN